MTDLEKSRQTENSITPYEKSSFNFFVLLFVSIKKHLFIFFLSIFQTNQYLIASKKEIAECPSDFISVLFRSISFFGETPTS
jgi:hypothetical protein